MAKSFIPAEKKKWSWGLLKRREFRVPTARGWLLLLTVFALVAYFLFHRVQHFLAVTDSIPGGALAVEGWAGDYAMKEAVAEFQRNHYDKVFVTGIPIEHGGPLSEYKTYAELGSAVLVKLGIPTNVVQAVPTPDVQKDRTYSSAVAIKSWIQQNAASVSAINVFTVGAHARRSRLLYQKALGKDVKIGVIAVPVREYDFAHWWRSSPGVRDVTGEIIAYLYVRVLFRASE